MRTLLGWFHKHIFFLFSLFLVAFIPLYPKLPILDVVQTWVYIRLEDFVIAIAALCVGIAFVRGRDRFGSFLSKPIVAYWVVGGLSLAVSLLVIGPSINQFAPQLAILHYLRRIEYMVVFFVALLAIRRGGFSLKTFVWVLLGTLLVVIVYGIGQKYAGFPAFLTMNEEFAKGVPLRLPPTARIASTFAGHYDLAAYLVLLLPVVGSLAFGVKRWWLRLALTGLGAGSLVLLLFTASRVSFGVYLVAISVMLWWQKKKLLIPVVVVGSIVLLNSVSGASERFAKTLRVSDVIVDLSTGQPIGTLEKVSDGSAVVELQERPDEESLPKGSGFIGVSQGQTTKPREAVDTISVYSKKSLATGSGEIATISGSFLIQRALVYDISFTTRLQGQWPKAMAAFERNVLTGSGYSTLSVAVDGWYMRLLGETGILGAVAYLGIFGYGFYAFLRMRPTLPPLERAFVIGYFAGLVGLLLNAILIDVFEASKVAYVFWIMTGVVVGILAPHTSFRLRYPAFLWRSLTHPLALSLYLVLAVFVWFGGGLGSYFTGDDFTWLKWATTATPADYLGYFTSAEGFFYRPVIKMLYAQLYTFFWLTPMAYHVVSFLLFGVSVVLVFLLSRQSGAGKFVAFSAALWYSALSLHHENVLWISGYSSLLGTVAALGALHAGVVSLTAVGWRWMILKISSWLLVAVALFSYEPVMPIVVIYGLVLWFMRKKFSVLDFVPLLILGIYWYLRNLSGAVGAEGDYGVKLTTFVPNSIGNVAAYLSAILAGPDALVWWDSIRQFMRAQPMTVRLFLVGAGVLLAAGAFVVRKHITFYKTAGLWFVMSLVSFGVVMGLGAASERYALLPSALSAISIATLVGESKRRNAFVVYALVFGVLSVSLWWNRGEVKTLVADWKTAGKIAEETLLRVKTEFKTVDQPKNFLFVNVPIRYGRAWVFPTGLSDAFWHVYRLSPFPITIWQYATLAEAFAFPTITGREVFIFDNFEVKRAFEEVKPVLE